MKKIVLATLILLFASPAVVISGPERVDFPENYQLKFVRYFSVDKPAGDKPAKIRFLYVHPDALAQAEPGEAVADGTILIMEDRKVELDESGEPKIDTEGRFIPTHEVTAIIVQEQQSGWGDSYSEDIRNGDWEYAVFNADATRKEKVEYEKCFACHKGQAADDYNFTFNSFVSKIK